MMESDYATFALSQRGKHQGKGGLATITPINAAACAREDGRDGTMRARQGVVKLAPTPGLACPPSARSKDRRHPPAQCERSGLDTH